MWVFAKENEQCELNSEVAFRNVVFEMNRKSDKLGGKLPSGRAYDIASFLCNSSRYK